MVFCSRARPFRSPGHRATIRRPRPTPGSSGVIQQEPQSPHPAQARLAQLNAVRTTHELTAATEVHIRNNSTSADSAAPPPPAATLQQIINM
jgi:hypothetical protein